MIEIRQHLVTLGFWPKEIDIYLAMLELGPTTVQSISKQANTQRSTTYDILETLKQKQLIHSIEREGKQIYIPASPTRLQDRVKEEEQAVQQKSRTLEQLLPQLMALFNSIEHKPKVRYFEGDEELRLVRKDVFGSNEPNWEFYAVNDGTLKIAKTHGKERVESTATKSPPGSRLLFTRSSEGLLPAYFDRSHTEGRELAKNPFPFQGSLTICGNLVVLIASKWPVAGVVIESDDMANLLKTLYQCAWNQAEPWQPPAEWSRS